MDVPNAFSCQSRKSLENNFFGVQGQRIEEEGNEGEGNGTTLSDESVGCL